MPITDKKDIFSLIKDELAQANTSLRRVRDWIEELEKE